MLLPFAMGTVTSVSSQRDRLPPPADCSDDEVVGVWKSHNFNPAYTHWSQFTLHVRRTEGQPDRLEGSISNHSWDGGPDQKEAPDCDRTSRRYVVSMDAVGTVKDGFIEFGGVGEWRMDRMICGLPTFGYNLDQFTGTIDQDIQEFQSVNNDGGISVNEPTVFRRVKCFVEEMEPTGPVEPPPFQPPKGLGCSLW